MFMFSFLSFYLPSFFLTLYKAQIKMCATVTLTLGSIYIIHASVIATVMSDSVLDVVVGFKADGLNSEV